MDKKEHDDFYLKTKNGNIFKLKKDDNNVYLIGLNQEEEGFDLVLSEYLSSEVSDILMPLFQNNRFVLKKVRENYSWKGSRIMLDNVENIGEYIEFYPTNDEAKIELFEAFGIHSSDLVVKSYFDL